MESLEFPTGYILATRECGRNIECTPVPLVQVWSCLSQVLEFAEKFSCLLFDRSRLNHWMNGRSGKTFLTCLNICRILMQDSFLLAAHSLDGQGSQIWMLSTCCCCSHLELGSEILQISFVSEQIWYSLIYSFQLFLFFIITATSRTYFSSLFSREQWSYFQHWTSSVSFCDLHRQAHNKIVCGQR